MNLLAVSTWYPWPPDNGAKLRAFSLLRELGRHHRVTLLTFCGDGEPDAGRLAPLTKFCESVQVIPRAAFHQGPLTRRGLLSPVPRAYVQGFSADMARAVRRAAPGHDAAVALEVTAGLYFLEDASIPVVLEEAEVTVIRDQVRAAHGLPRVRRRLTWWKYARFVRTLARRAAFTTVVSEAERAILEDIGCEPRRLAVVPNGADTADLDWPRDAVEERLIYPGSLTYSANRDAVQWFLQSTLPLVHRARPQVEFWVTGATGAEPLTGVRPEARFVLTGHLPDVRPAVAGSAVCVVPLRIGGGTRLKILQAMALGTPVVSTSKGAEGLDVTPGRDILIGDTPETLASHVLRLLTDRGFADQVAAAARALVRDRYTWARSGAILEDVLRRAVPGRRAMHP